MKEILLKEYEVLKTEQLERIKQRDNVIYMLLGVNGTLFSFSIINSATYVISIIPMINFVLCWLYLSDDRKISNIGNYIKEDLSIKLLNISKENISIFNWEDKHRQYKGRKVHKLIQFIVDTIIFTFPQLVALIITLVNENNMQIFIVDIVFLIGTLTILVLHYMNKNITQEE